MADKPKFSLITDSMELKVDGLTELDGITSVPAVIAKNLVQDYSGLKVWKPADELEAAARFADGIPITRGHPDAGIVTDRGQVLGFLNDPKFGNDELSGILNIADRDLAADVKDGKLKGLSIGFFCSLDETGGVAGDVHYDAIQKDIFLNHIAIVDEGRCSIADGCKFNMDVVDSPPDMVVDATIQAKLDTITADRDALRAELETIIKTEKDGIIAELTAMQDAKTKEDLEKLKLDELKKELDMVKELRTDRLSLGRGRGSGRMSAIDAAYAGVVR